MKLFILIVIILAQASSLFLCAQKEAANWYFGAGGAVTFNTPNGTPAVLPASPMIAKEGCSSISDAQGNRLFYTNGESVWNRNHEIMMNGDGLYGHIHSAQTALIVPKPGAAGIYYIFTTGFFSTDQAQRKGLCYSVVDMSLDGGKGAVRAGEKNINLMADCAESITAVRHANGADIWVAAHEVKSNRFRLYLVTAGGVALHHTDAIGDIYGDKSGRRAYMKFSPAGNKLAALHSLLNGIEVFDFDNNTGVISDVKHIEHSMYYTFYTLEFSMCGNIVYTSIGTEFGGELWQFDLNAGTESMIGATAKKIFTGTSYFAFEGLQMGPDKKIYMARVDKKQLCVINNPGIVGKGCDFKENILALPLSDPPEPEFLCLGLPNFVQSYFWTSPISLEKWDVEITGTESICENDDIVFSAKITPDTKAVYHWDGPWSFSADGPEMRIKKAQLSQKGQYTVTVTVPDACAMTFTRSLTVDINAAPKGSITGKTKVCQGESTLLTAKSDGKDDTYEWGDGSTEKTREVSEAGWYDVKVTDADGCSAVFSTEVFMMPSPEIEISGKTVLCEGEETQLTVTSAADYLYEWSTGATKHIIPVDEPGKYWVSVTNKTGCTAYDTIEVSVIGDQSVNIEGVLSICDGKSTELRLPEMPGAELLWSNGATGSSITVAEAGKYWVYVKSGEGCEGSDTVDVKVSPLPEADIIGETVICDGKTTQLSVTPAPDLTYKWSTGNTTNLITVTKAGEYWVRATNKAGCEAYDTVQVTVISDESVSITGDLDFCEGESTLLSIEASEGSDLLWSTGETGGSIIAEDAGKYWVRVMNSAGCEASDTVEVLVSPSPVAEIEGGLLLCEGASAELSVALEAGETCLWSTGETGEQISVSQAGRYHVTVINEGGCEASDTVQVSYNPVPVVEIEGGTHFCAGGSSRLSVKHSEGNTYLWNTGATGSFITVTIAGNYSVTVTNAQGCSASSAEVSVTVAPAISVSVDSAIVEIGTQDASLKIGARTESGTVHLEKLTVEIDFDKQCFLPHAGQDFITGSDVGQDGKKTLVLEAQNVILTAEKKSIFEISGTALLTDRLSNPVVIREAEAPGTELCTDFSDGVIVSEKICFQNLRQVILIREAKAELSPNPASDLISVEISGDEEGLFDIGIYDMQGRKAGGYAMDYMKGVSGPAPLDISSCPGGAYNTLISTPSGKVISLPLLIVR